QKAREQPREISGVGLQKIIGAGKRRIGADAVSLGAGAERPAQAIEHRALLVAPEARRSRPPALTDPDLRRRILDDAQQRLTDLREQMNMLMSVDEIGHAPEQRDEGLELGRDLERQQ